MSGILVNEGDPKYPKLEAPYIKLYTLDTPNGVKVSILLELLKLKYYVRKINIASAEQEQKQDWFIELNPNGRIPVLSDVNAQGERTTLMESASILLYLSEKYDQKHQYSFKHGTKEYYETLQWLFFQMGGIGPMQGQAHHFSFYAKEKIPYGIQRYVDETKRLYGVLEIALKKNNTGYLVSDHLSIADIVSFGWVRVGTRLDIDIAKDFPAVYQWLQAIEKLPEVQRGLTASAEYNENEINVRN
ncbi:nitrogen catabolite repression transcriptional regulator [Ascoidea rubescens DSM 1968]|uniref:Nitrogen catabolite repression transcriptional regulator n=1 Tax=Ascoidea rubescens DSM 1968 TaxID=1344418 RepID=A0A1D2VF48_9ASCO|nr:nitrogen catabolite repression transcriptional regulator [Ascoidea rubescens DSM 1968]ODV60256.1 nitrogen catabolite repression transcriptional regulator [Ascoidea rubescens DSM 1968]